MGTATPMKENTPKLARIPPWIVVALGLRRLGKDQDLHQYAMQVIGGVIGPRDFTEWSYTSELAHHLREIQNLRLVKSRVVEKLLTAEPKEMAALLELNEQLEAQIAAAQKRYDDGLRQLAVYRHGLGDQLRKDLNQLLEGEYQLLSEEAVSATGGGDAAAATDGPEGDSGTATQLRQLPAA